jgi:hypothetical protein
VPAQSAPCRQNNDTEHNTLTTSVEENIPILSQPRDDTIDLAGIEVPLDAVDIVAGSGLVAAGQVSPPTLTHNTCTSPTVLHIVQQYRGRILHFVKQ